MGQGHGRVDARELGFRSQAENSRQEADREDEQAAEDLSSRRAEELSLHKAEEDLIRKALEKYGNRKQAAAELGISERTLYRKLSEMGYGKLKETKK